MNAGGGSVANPVVVRWKGGTLREQDLDRAVLTRRALNQFLMVLRAEATGEQPTRPPLPEGERAVVRTLVLAQEAEAEGVVVSDQTVNNFLQQWTQNRITPGQIGSLIGQLRERVGFTEQTLFDAIRRLILASETRSLVEDGVSFPTRPPGWRWDAFCKLERAATVEVVPVVAEQLSGRVAEPKPGDLEGLFERYKDDLPRARSATPGFREPARIRYDALVAPADLFMEAVAAEVTDEQIRTYYEDNKERLYRAVPGASEAQAEQPGAGADGSEQSAGEPEAASGEPAPSVEAPAESPAGPTAEPPAETPPSDLETGRPEADGAASVAGGRFQTVAFRQPDGAAAAEQPATESEPAEPATEPAAGEPAGDEPAEPAADEPAGRDAADPGFEPLDKVRDAIREQIAREAANRRKTEIFEKVAGVIGRYAEAVEEAIEFEEPLPPPPDVEALAAEHGLEAVRSGLVDASEAVAAGGIGSSVAFAFSEQFGMRQQAWVAAMFSPDAPQWRPLETGDMQGNRYLSWKTEDRPDYVPEFADVRDEVERVWKLIEARPLARELAGQIAKDTAAGQPLTAAAAAAMEQNEDLEVVEVGPFTWLTRGTAPFGSPPMLSQPEGLEMPGAALMAAVFALEPGQTTVAFNEPETVCYAIRLASMEPDEETLRSRFVDDGTDARRLAVLASREAGGVMSRWLEAVEERNGVEWKRPAR